MKRMSLPPSRRHKPEDWKERITIIARDITDMERSARPLRGPTALRAAAVFQFRHALDPAVADAALHTVSDGRAMVMPCIAVRIVLMEEGFDWRPPAAAESVMVVAERAIDDALRVDHEVCENNAINEQTGQPMNWRDRIRVAMQLFVACERQLEPDQDAAQARKLILADFREAMGEAPTAEMHTTMKLEPADGGPPRDEEMMSRSGTFRLVLSTEDVDWYQPENAAEAMRVACEALDAALGA